MCQPYLLPQQIDKGGKGLCMVCRVDTPSKRQSCRDDAPTLSKRVAAVWILMCCCCKLEQGLKGGIVGLLQDSLQEQQGQCRNTALCCMFDIDAEA